MLPLARDSDPDLSLAGSERGVDRTWYLQTNPDVAGAGIDPVVHYHDHGWREGRDPRPDFSTSHYLAANADVTDNPLVHYLRREESSSDPVSAWHRLQERGRFFPILGHTSAAHGSYGTPGGSKILAVGHDASRTGAPLVLLRLIEALRRSTGAEFFLLLERGGPLLDDYRRVAHVLVNDGALDGAIVQELIASLAEPGPSFAISNCAESWQLVEALRWAGLAHVVSLVHERLLRYPSEVCRSIRRNADRVVFSAAAVKQAAIAALPSFDDALVLPQGLLDPQFGYGDRGAARAAVRRRLGLPADALIVLGCGTRHFRKGIDLFVQLAARVRDRTSRQVHFVWLGAPLDEANLEQFLDVDIANLRLASSLSLLDEVDDPEPYFLAADTFVLPSRDDPFPCVVLEAMACALPVVVFEGSGGAVEAVAEGCGIAVPYLDIEAMADAVISLVTKPSYRTAIGQRAESRVRTTYRFCDYAEQVLQLCESATQSSLPRLEAPVVDAKPAPEPPAPAKQRFLTSHAHLRSMVRSDEWWTHKLIPMLAVFYATSLLTGDSIASHWDSAALLLLAIATCAAYVSLINDVTDRAVDRRAGKSNDSAAWSVSRTSVVLGLPLLGGLGFCLLWREDLPLVGAYMGSWVAFSLYSIRPFRLKTRGVLGVLADASGAHVFPALAAALLALRASGSPVEGTWIGSVAMWALGFGMRGILWHELVDIDADRVAGVRTFVVRRSPAAAVRLARLAFLAELAGLGVMLWQLQSAWPVAMVAGYLVFAVARARLRQVKLVLAKPTDRYVLLGQEFYLGLLPLGILIPSAVHFPADWAVVGAHLLVFGRPLALLLEEAVALRPNGSPPPVVTVTVEQAIDAATSFVKDQLHAGRYGLDALGGDGSPRFPHDHGHVFVAASIAEALADRLDEIDRTILLIRILSEEQDGLWGYQSPGLIADETTRPFLVDADDSAYVIRTLHLLGVNRQPDRLMRFYREREQMFVTWDTPGSPVLTSQLAVVNNFQAHPEVNANIYLALRGSELEQYVNDDLLLQAQHEHGYWQSFFYPSALYGTLLVLDLTTDNPRFGSARARALAFVASWQKPNGSWGDDPYETALAVAALTGQPGYWMSLDRGVQYLLSTMADDGSWASSACIWESFYTESDLWRGYDSHRTFVTSRCLIALRRARGIHAIA